MKRDTFHTDKNTILDYSKVPSTTVKYIFLVTAVTFNIRRLRRVSLSWHLKVKRFFYS